MALRIPVQKDIGEYEEKIVGKMSLRTLACVSLGFGSAVGAAAFVHLGLHADVADAAFPIMLCSMPFWLAGFWRPFGMRAEELLPLLAAHELSPQLHMMPKKWRNKWGALDDEAATRRDRKLLTLGNLAIITHSLNASIRDADWPTKKQGKGYKDGLALCAAGLATMAGALEKESWDEGDIADRAEWLADKALEVWR